MKILIVKTSSLGDIIHAFPVIQYIRQVYPAAQIDWVVEKPFSGLINTHPEIHQVFCVDTKNWRKQLLDKTTWQQIKGVMKQIRANQYDIVLDLQGNIKSGLITGLSRGKRKVGFSSSSVPEWPNVLFTNKRYTPPKGRNIREDYLFLAQLALQKDATESKKIELKVSPTEGDKINHLLSQTTFSKGNNILVCAGSNWPNKQLSTETLRELLIQLHHEIEGHFLLAWGTEEEKKEALELAKSFPNASLVIDRLPLATLQNLMSKVDLVVAMDSLPLHLAGTTSTPTFSVFGPSLAAKYNPTGIQHKAFQGSCPYGRLFEKRCPILRTCPTGSCMKDLKGNELFQDFETWWNSPAMVDYRKSRKHV